MTGLFASFRIDPCLGGPLGVLPRLALVDEASFRVFERDLPGFLELPIALCLSFIRLAREEGILPAGIVVEYPGAIDMRLGLLHLREAGALPLVRGFEEIQQSTRLCDRVLLLAWLERPAPSKSSVVREYEDRALERRRALYELEFLALRLVELAPVRLELLGDVVFRLPERRRRVLPERVALLLVPFPGRVAVDFVEDLSTADSF